MPKLDGMGLLRLMRNRGIEIPVVFLTALGKPIDRLEGLELGAVEYIVKPIELKELSLRIQNLLHFGDKKPNQAPIKKIGGKNILSPEAIQDTEHDIEIGEIVFNPISQMVRRKGILISLSPKEFGILKLLMLHRGSIVSTAQIFEQVWHDRGSRFSEYSSTITVHIAYLRRKLGNDLIRTVKLAGYIIDLD